MFKPATGFLSLATFASSGLWMEWFATGAHAVAGLIHSALSISVFASGAMIDRCVEQCPICYWLPRTTQKPPSPGLCSVKTTDIASNELKIWPCSHLYCKCVLNCPSPVNGPVQ